MPRMDPEARFPLSKLPMYLEWYRCYEDLSRSRFVDGMELFNHWDEWNEDQIARWHFFYRPVRARVGRPQKRRIWTRRAKIRGLTMNLTTQNTIYGVGLGVCGLLALAGLQSSGLVLFAALVAAVATLVFLAVRSNTRAEIRRLEAEIDDLWQEVKCLIRQMPGDLLPTQELERRLGADIQRIEQRGFAALVAKDKEDPSLFQDLRVRFVSVPETYRIESLLIHGWGAIQPASIQGPFGRENTGLVTASRRLGQFVTTWRVGSQGQPLFRLLFLQFVFLLPKNLNAYSLFLDVVTGDLLGCRSETFQYNHVTNLMLREVALGEDEWLKWLKLPTRFQEDLLRVEFHALGVALASGAHFRCVLTDRQMIETLSSWQDSDERLEELGRSQDDEEAAPTAGFRGSPAPTDGGFGSELNQDIASTIAELRSRSSSAKLASDNNAVRAAQEVRRQLESYVQTVSLTERLEGPSGKSILSSAACAL